ncbi:hypothetical protein JOD24_003038 [Kroppenstedtia sanguinis]|uniref:Uncharacterized protein n=1 Tax=Kroppenstedtia sanguinis TaxID=1380684 RepID=A0ABW4C5J2_9BACL
MINQKMGGGRESCAAKATFAPQHYNLDGLKPWNKGSHPTQRRIWREGV